MTSPTDGLAAPAAGRLPDGSIDYVYFRKAAHKARHLAYRRLFLALAAGLAGAARAAHRRWQFTLPRPVALSGGRP